MLLGKEVRTDTHLAKDQARLPRDFLRSPQRKPAVYNRYVQTLCIHSKTS